MPKDHFARGRAGEKETSIVLTGDRINPSHRFQYQRIDPIMSDF